MIPAMKSRKGYTLAELMVAMIIAMLVVGAVVSVFMTINTSVFGLSEAIALNARARVIQERIAFDVRNIKSLSAVGAQSFTGTAYNYATGATYEITYSLETESRYNELGQKVDQGVLKRTIGGVATVVMDGLIVTSTDDSDGYSVFRYANRIGTLTDASEVTSYTANEVTSIRFDLVPAKTERQKKGQTRTAYDPFCSALFQLRNYGTTSSSSS